MFSFDRLVFTKTFNDAYATLSSEKQKQCDKALRFLKKNPQHPGLRLKPILPAKVYYEASINMADRIVLRPDGNVARLIDAVTHDKIVRYGSGKAR